MSVEHVGHLGFAYDQTCPACGLREHIARALGEANGAWWEETAENFQDIYREYADKVLAALAEFPGVISDAIAELPVGQP